MELTRVDTKKLTVAVEQAKKKLDEAAALLRPFLAPLSDAERKTMLRPRDGFGPAARQLARELEKFPQIGAAVGLDTEALIEDLDNVEVLWPLMRALDDLSRDVSDSKLLWNAEAADPAFSAYAVAKTAAKRDAKLQVVVDALAPVLANHRARKVKAPAAQAGNGSPQAPALP
jgi:hypothetical protein